MRDAGNWGFGSFVNPFASLITTEKDDDDGTGDDYDADQYDYGTSDYGIADYGIVDYEDDHEEEYEGSLEGFNITMFEDSAAVQRVQAAVM